jgi:hypothetical protein
MKVLTMNKPKVAPAVPLVAASSIAIHAAEAGSAILTFDRDAQDNVEVSRIDRLPAGLDPCVDWLRSAFPDFPGIGTGHVVIDADGLGQALWDRLDVRYRRGWTLYDKRGRDRQELVNALLVAQSEGRVAIGPTPHADAMRKALIGYRRTVGEDGVVGGELVVALALAVVGRRPPRPRVM